MARSMVLHSTQRDAYVHDGHCRTYDARCTQERGGVDGSRLRLSAAYCRSLETEPKGIDAKETHSAIFVGPDESMLGKVHGQSPGVCLCDRRLVDSMLEAQSLT